ncbi:MAG TPA: hypothetical protein VIM02_03150 [Rhizomicrobium sp.]
MDLPLDPGERVLWTGFPQRGLMFRPQDIFVVPFSIAWCGFAVFWEVSVASTKAPPFFLLWGGGFVAVGLYFVFGRFAVDAISRARTIYAVTNRRVLILSGLTTRKLQSLALGGLTELELQERSNRRGTITFGRPTVGAGNWGRSWPGSSRNAAPAFEGIENAQQVYDMIRRAQQDAKPPSAGQ